MAEPRLFEIVIMIGVDTYRYGFEANAEKVYREWLYVKAGKKRSKEIELFYREENKYELVADLENLREMSPTEVQRFAVLLYESKMMVNKRHHYTPLIYK